MENPLERNVELMKELSKYAPNLAIRMHDGNFEREIKDIKVVDGVLDITLDVREYKVFNNFDELRVFCSPMEGMTSYEVKDYLINHGYKAEGEYNGRRNCKFIYFKNESSHDYLTLCLHYSKKKGGYEASTITAGVLMYCFNVNR